MDQVANSVDNFCISHNWAFHLPFCLLCNNSAFITSTSDRCCNCFFFMFYDKYALIHFFPPSNQTTLMKNCLQQQCQTSTFSFPRKFVKLFGSPKPIADGFCRAVERACADRKHPSHKTSVSRWRTWKNKQLECSQRRGTFRFGICKIKSTGR